MKKYIILFIVLGITFSCSDFGDLNNDPKAPTDVPAETLFPNATKNLVDLMTDSNVNSNIFRLFAQHWTETTYTDESNYILTERDQPGTVWTTLYVDVLRDLDETRKIITSSESSAEDPKITQNKLACISVLEVFTYHVLVDVFADIPFSNALDIDNVLPNYDNDEEIYTTIINTLNVAINNINLGFGGFQDMDLLYGGDMSKWKKFANSLKLRLAVRIASVNTSKASTMATEAITSGVFTSNADNATFQYLSAFPNTNPVWNALVRSGRQDYIPANTVVDIMNTLEDPRRSAYFDENLGTGVYVGGNYGEQAPYQEHTHLGTSFHQPDTPGILMDYSEVSFLQAEAAELLLHGSSSDAENHYNNGITASFDFWDIEIGNYLTKPDVAYTTASSSWQETLAVQKWLALFNRGFEAWTTYRKYGYPTMKVPPISNEAVPRRFTYPADEPSRNGSSYTAAASAIGGDLKSSKVFWDQ